MADRVLENGLILTDFADQMARFEDRRYQQYARQREAQDYDRKLATENAANAARRQAATGDMRGAQATAAAGDAWDVWGQIDATQKAQVAKQAEAIGTAAYNLRRLPQGQARADYFRAYAPTLLAHGMTQEELAQYATSGVLDNDELLSGFADRAVGITNLWKADQDKIEREYKRETDLMQPITAADGAVLTRAADGSLTPVYTPGTKPDTQIIRNEDGSSSLVTIPGTPGTSYGTGDYSRDAIRGAESGGNDGARNPLSSATGRYQFTGPTARGVLSQNPGAFPEARGMTRDQLTQYGQRADVQERMMDIVEPQYRAAIERVGAAPNAQNMYMMHFLGPQTGSRFIAQNPGMNAREAIRQIDPRNADAIISANPVFGQNATVASVINTMGGRVGGGGGQRVPSGGDAPTVTNLGGGRSGPEWRDETRTINGQQVQGQVSTKTGQFRPFGGAAKAKGVSDPVAAASAASTARQTVERLLSHPGLGWSVGAYSLAPTIPGTRQADFKSMIETLKSQVFLGQISQMKGMGALTDAEGARLTASIASLDLRQSEEQIRRSLQDIGAHFVLAERRARQAQSGGGQSAPAQGGGNRPPAGATATATGPNGQKMAKVNGRWVAY